MKIEKISLFEKYMTGELKGKQLENFIKKLQESDELKSDFFSFREAVNLHFDPIQAIYKDAKVGVFEESKHSVSLKPKSALARSLEGSHPITKNKLFLLFAIAASFLLLVFFLWPSRTTDKINYLTLHEIHPLLLPHSLDALSADGNPIDPNIYLFRTEILNHYNKKEFNLIISKMENIDLTLYPQDAIQILNLFKGSAYLEMNDYENAITYLSLFEQKVSESKRYKGPKELATLHRALALLGQGKKEEGILLLQRLNQPTTNGPVQRAADSILIKLN